MGRLGQGALAGRSGAFAAGRSGPIAFDLGSTPRGAGSTRLAVLCNLEEQPTAKRYAYRPKDEGIKDVEHQTKLHVSAKLISRRRGGAQPIVPRASRAS
jgi:hypothetical protein